MKAISFLEYFKQLCDIPMCSQDLIYNSIKYSNKVSQPFSFEKVVELFEGFEIKGITLIYDNIAFLNNIQSIEYIVDYKNFKENIRVNGKNHTKTANIMTPKTIDEFIVLCNNLNIELQWKQ